MSSDDSNSVSRWSPNRRGFLKSSSAAAVGLGVLGGGVNYAVDTASAASAPEWTDNWASTHSYDNPCTGIYEATIGNNFGAGFVEMGSAQVGCPGTEHWEYRFGVFGIAQASAETDYGVEGANWLDGHSVDINADADACGSDGPTINSYDSYAIEMEASAVNSWFDTSHYAEDSTVDDFYDVEYWCNQWEQDHSDVDKDSDFSLWDVGLTGFGVMFGVGGMVTSSYTLGLLSVGTSVVSLLDGFVDYGDRNVEYEDDTTISISHHPNTESLTLHYVDFVVDVPPNTSLTLEVNQSANWKGADYLCGPIDPQSDLSTSQCYQINIPSNPPPSETSDPLQPSTSRCTSPYE